ncbi:hypothetical protein CBR_g50138 [Chara braunii]|uniref:Uncharacterized protein n=1 Tax=Chara braunii TaxID=69332 RepID=A0A388M6B1_CHABU|nr:hypothetical protein CBR_g50138 [Chara braunii]|eukprot:GBG90045.1 hypothetical protein CBR_g50138 [Chara braunii]
MSGSPLLRMAQVYSAPWLGGAAGMQGAEGGLKTTLAGKVSVVAVEGGGVRASRGGMTVLAAAQTPTLAQNGRALLSGKDTARRDKTLREVLLRDLEGRRASVTGEAACPGEGEEDELEALGHRESRVLQVVVDGLWSPSVDSVATESCSPYLSALKWSEKWRPCCAERRGRPRKGERRWEVS